MNNLNVDSFDNQELPTAIKYQGKVYVMADEVESTICKEDSFPDVEFINIGDSWLRYDSRNKNWSLEKYKNFDTKEVEKSIIDNIEHNDFHCALDDCSCDIFNTDFHQEDCTWYDN